MIALQYTVITCCDLWMVPAAVAFYLPRPHPPAAALSVEICRQMWSWLVKGDEGIGLWFIGHSEHQSGCEVIRERGSGLEIRYA